MGRLRTREFSLYNGSDPKAVEMGMVRLKDGYAVVGHSASGASRLYVKVVDSWQEGGNWGGYLQVTRGDYKDYYIDSKDGWVAAYSGKYDPVTFVDKGDHYEIRQKRDLNGSSLIVQNNKLRFRPQTPGQWSIYDVSG
ncbi:hypothetical protein [Streptomyces sp. NPDC101393]|uniref:hypothetical protein n=1 Tax=Streptomyces sp. NPDC101393 TaxID=3366141 RepID=UPI0038050B4E